MKSYELRYGKDRYGKRSFGERRWRVNKEMKTNRITSHPPMGSSTVSRYAGSFIFNTISPSEDMAFLVVFEVEVL